jgi:hypothetical protein
MAYDTPVAPSGVATDEGVGFADAADILSRLRPDDLHPARLAGPHAWHPWDLTIAPPNDRSIRLVLPAGTGPSALEQLLDRLETRLGRTPWPPEKPLSICRHGRRLSLHNDGAQRSLIETAVASDAGSPGHAEVVTRRGWPILDELATLNERIQFINAHEPGHRDLTDLTSWVAHKMAEPAGAHPLAASLPELLSRQIRHHPASTDRLRTILSHRDRTAVQQPRVLDYLAEQLDHCEELDCRHRH